MNTKFTERIKYWSQLLLLPLYGLSFLMPRNRRIWLFGSTFGRRFAENPRYLYLYVCQHADELGVRPVWISHNKQIVTFLNENGYEAYYYHSLKGILLALRAGIYIFDNYSKDINFWQSGGAVKFNLWHGSGNKRTNHDNMHDRFRHPRNFWERWTTFPRRISDEKPTDYTLATSPAMRDIFVSAFATDEAHIILEGYPRNDGLFAPEESGIVNLLSPAENNLLDKIMKYREQGYRILTYMPTFRDSEKIFFDVMDLNAFNEFLVQEKFIFVTKLHVKSKLKQEFEAIDYSNILNGEADIDVYSFLGEVDLLITDYSSVYTDFMLLDRPVIAFQYDWTEYSKDTRECYIDQDEYMPEVKAVNMQELMDGIRLVLEHDVRLENRHKSRNRMFIHLDAKSSKRLTDIIIEKFV